MLRPQAFARGSDLAEPMKEDKRPRGWPRLLLVAVLAAVAGFMAVANWRTRNFSLYFASVNVRAGIVIIASVALGFLTGLAFSWSARDREHQ